MNKTDTKVLNEEVIYSTSSILQVSQEDIFELINKAKLNDRKRIRLCAHHNVTDRLHEMIIVHHVNTYVRPHKHINKIESFHLIHGECDVVLFDENGNIEEVIELSALNKRKYFYYRLSRPIFHTIVVQSEVVVFHEITNGPFNREETIFASWAPEENHIKASENYMLDLIKRVQAKIGV